MNIFTFLFCILMSEVKSQTTDIFPARILAPQKTLSENSNLYVICSTFGFKKHISVWVYLCNNGTGVKKYNQKPEENDTTFTIDKVRPTNSGEYSCVYSLTDYEPSEVNATGNNQIRISVIANFQPADLSLSGPSSVNQGAQVEFVCSLPNVLQAPGDCGFIQSYLMRDKAIYQVQGFNVKQRKARFVIQDAVQKESGRFSCAVRPSQCFKEDEEELAGNNIIVLQVKAFPLEQTVFLTIIALILLLGVCLCAKWRRDVSTSRMKHPQVNGNAIELQRVIEREEQSSDAQDGEHSGYQNVGSDNDPYSYVLDADPMYDDVLPSAGRSNSNPSEPAYAVSMKMMQKPYLV